MNRERHKRNYDLHSWAGITLGLIVFVVSLTGCFALFADELRTWEDPAQRLEVPDTPIAITDQFDAWLKQHVGEDHVEFVRFDYPSETAPYYAASILLNTEHGLKDHHAHWNAETGEPIAERGDGLSVWLLDIHRDFMWPGFLGGRTIGRGLVGVAGVVLLLAILTGIVAHTKIREEAYAMRLKRSPRLKWQDTHKVVGLWGLPFFIMIAFTGAVLGIVALLAPIVAAIAFKGDIEALQHEIFGEHAEPTGVQVQMLSLEELHQIHHPDSDRAPVFATFENYGDETTVVDLFYDADSELLMNEVISVSGATGERVSNLLNDDMKAATRVNSAIAPLHYATYGGIWLKLLYFVLGLGLAVITALGSMMWIERRKYGNEGARPVSFYDRLGHFNTGIVMGLPVATLTLFYLDKLYTGAEAGRLAATGWTYFSVWGAGLLFAFLRRNDYQTTRTLLLLSGLLAMGIPMLNGVVTGDWFIPELIEDGPVHALVDLSMLLAGCATVLAGLAAPSRRIEKQRTPGSRAAHLPTENEKTAPG